MDQWDLKKACLECNWSEFLKQLEKTPQINEDIIQVCIFWGRLKYLEKILDTGKASISPEHIELVLKRNHWHILDYIIKNKIFLSVIFCSTISYYKTLQMEKYRNECKKMSNEERIQLRKDWDQKQQQIFNIIKSVAQYLTFIDDDVFDNLCYIENIDLLKNVLQYDITFTPKLKYSWPVNDFLYNNRQFCIQILKEIDGNDLKKIAYQPRFLQCPIEKYLDWNEGKCEFVRWRISRHALALASVFPPYVIENIISFCFDPEYRNVILFHHRMEIIIKIVNILKRHS